MSGIEETFTNCRKEESVAQNLTHQRNKETISRLLEGDDVPRFRGGKSNDAIRVRKKIGGPVPVGEKQGGEGPTDR